MNFAEKQSEEQPILVQKAPCNSHVDRLVKERKSELIKLSIGVAN